MTVYKKKILKKIDSLIRECRQIKKQPYMMQIQISMINARMEGLKDIKKFITQVS